MVSKTSLTQSIRACREAEVRAGLAERPDLLACRDERGRNWLHILCMTPLKPGMDAQASIRIAEHLLALGFDIDDAAFTEGRWQATPLWHAIARGRNHPLATWLLARGCNPNHCLFAAAWNEDEEAIRLLIAHGATVDDDSAEGETPLLGAVGWSKFGPARLLLEAGANPDFQDPKGRTCLHLMLAKGSAPEQVKMLIAHGARGDIADGEGRTALEIIRRKRDPVWRGIADRLVANSEARRNRVPARSFPSRTP